jgi:hypothetical protein
MARPDEDRLILSLDVAKGRHLPDVLRDVADSMDDRDGDETGYARHAHGEDTSWRISRPADGAPIDARQREAAALLLMAVDLPLDATLWAKSMMEGCMVNPGMRMAGMPSRIGGLREARRLVDEMLTEAGEPAPTQQPVSTTPDAEDDDVRVLRLYRLTPEEDEAISRLAIARNMSRGDLVVAAVRRYIAESSA